MSKIDKLSIRGIRSFSPDREQTIEFFAPLTMIVGANGCGKTTIIECLKYATTGLLPPGGRSGQSWIHDPKVSNQQEVKASIKLRFMNRAGQVMVCVRSFQLKQMKKTLQFKALDGVIRTTNELGERVSMSHKCSELDRQLPQLIGVSRAIMENVIFCHQEDSSWPLQEGAVLKKKFDDIFESTRYSKALDAIRKSKTEYAATAKDLQVDLAALAEKMKAAEDLQADLVGAEDRAAAVDGGVREVENLAREAEEELAALGRDLKKVEQLEERARRLEGQLEGAAGELRAKREALDQDFEESEEELQQLLARFAEEHGEWRAKLERQRERVSRARGRLAAAAGRRGELLQRRGRHEAALAQLAELAAERARLAARLAAAYALPAAAAAAAAGDGDGVDLVAFKAQFEEKRRESDRALQDLRAAHRLEEDKMQSTISRLTAEKTTIASKQNSDEKELQKVQDMQRDISKQFQAISGRGRITKQQLDDAKQALEEASRKVAEANSDDKVKQIKQETKEKEKELMNVKVEMDADHDSLQQLTENAAQQQRLGAEQAQLEDLEQTLSAKVDENLAQFREVGIRISVDIEDIDNAEVELSTRQAEAEAAQKARNETAKNLQKQLTTLDAHLTTARRAADGLRADAAAFAAAGGPRARAEAWLQRAAAASSAMLEQAEEDDWQGDELLPPPGFPFTGANLEAAVEVMKNYEAFWAKLIGVNTMGIEIIDSLLQKAKSAKNKKGTACCPSCRQNMDDGVYEEFIKRHEKMKSRQDEHEEYERFKNESTVEGQALLELWRQGQGFGPALEEEEGKVAAWEEEREGVQADLAAESAAAGEQDEALARLAALAFDLQGLREKAQALEQKRAAVEAERRRFESANPYSDGRTLKEVQLSYNQNKERYEDLLRAKDRLAKDKDRLQDRLNLLNLQRQTAEEELRAKSEAWGRARELEARKEELKSKQNTLLDSISALSQQTAPLDQELKKHENERRRLRGEWAGAERALEQRVNRGSEDYGQFLRICDKIQEKEDEDIEGQMKILEAQVADIETATNKDEEELSVMEPEVRRLENDIEQKDAVKRNIETAVEVRQLERAHAGLQAQRDRLAAEARETGKGGQLAERAAELRADLGEFQRQRAHAEGRRRALGEQIKHLTAKLKSNNYFGVEEKHRNKLIDYETTQMAVQDLEKYWTALDKALMQFHRMKIEDINKIIRELWQITYQGNDIESIEIVSGEEGTSNRAGRSYNYRVCMTKGDAHLDMKGRCSAGQRVLSSIVIRLALAETFCLNCGILALDEPTTNLDSDNKRGLANALAKIIAARSKQTNFQLLAITHDEEFVAMMRNELASHAGFSMPEYFYRVSREELRAGRFYSRIDRNDWAEL